jgi:hypothetical protein
VHRLAGPLDLCRAEIAQREVPGNQLRRMRGEQHASGLSQLLHPGRQPDRVPERRVVHAQIVADASEHHFPGVQSHADGETEPVRDAHRIGIAPQLASQRQRSVAGPLGVILVGDRRAEQGHDPITGVLIDRAFDAVDALGENGEKAVENLVPGFRIHLFGQIHRAFDVGEQHRHLLALAVQRAAHGKDLLRQVRRRIRPRRRRRACHAGERSATRGAELR